MGAPGMGRGAVDLAAMGRQATELNRPLTVDEERDIRQQAETQLGLRCHGCGRRIAMGFAFTAVNVGAKSQDGKPVVDVAQVHACGRPDCDLAEAVRREATVCTMIENVWLDGRDDYGVLIEAPDAPPADAAEQPEG